MKLFNNKNLSTLEYNLRINNINGFLQAFSLNLVVPFASMYAKRLNATDNDIALINSYPAVFCLIAVFFGTYLFRKYQNKKKLSAILFGFARAFFLIFIIIPFLPLWLQPGLFVLLYGMMNFPNSIATMGWQSYMGDIFSNTWRGRAFSKRNSLSTIASLIVTFVTGNLLYYIPKNNSQRILLYQVFFVIAFMVAIIEIYSFTKHKLDTSSKHIEQLTLVSQENIFVRIKSIFHMVCANKRFFDYCICVIIFHFAWQMGWPLFFSYEFDILHSNEAWTSLESTVSFISQAFAFIMWQKLSEKKGNYFAIFIAILTMALCPFFYMISTSMYQVVLFTMITGSAYAGTFLLLSNNLYETAPDENRTVYIAVFTIITNITLMIAPIVGMQLKKFTNIYTALLIVGILRLIAAFMFYLRYRKYKKINKECCN